MIVGTSVGSLIGAMYASNPNSFELEWTSFELEKDDIFDFSPFFLPRPGLLRAIKSKIS